MKRIFDYFYKLLFPLRYAKYIGVNFGTGCRFIKVDFSTEPYLITVGNHVSATKVRFETHDGGVWVARDKFSDIDVVKPIVIGNNVFIGYGAIVLPGVKIGDNVVIGAHSVVSRDIPSNVVAAGVPAKVIKGIDEYIEKSIKGGDKTKSFTKDQKRKYYLDKYSK